METLKDLKNFFRSGYLEYMPGITVDCAIFGYRDDSLQLLLAKNKIMKLWCLPGGFIRKNEGLDEASARVTAERTGIDNLFLKQFKTFGDPDRNKSTDGFDPEGLYEISGIRIKSNNWLVNRTLTVGFYAISDIVRSVPKADFLSSECRWFPVEKVPKLAFDHNEIFKEALVTMRMHLYHYPVGRNLLPQKFTLKEIRRFYEIMSGKTLHATNFPNKLLKMGLIIRLPEKKSIGAHRSPTYYSFNNEVYEKALKDGLVLI